MNCTFEQKIVVWELLDSLKDDDEQIFSVIIEMFRKEKIQDCQRYLLNKENQNHYQKYTLQVENLTLVEKEQRLNIVRNNIQRITNVIKKIKDHKFNKNDYSTVVNFEKRQVLINKIKDKKQIYEFLKFLVHLTSIDNEFIQYGSNALQILVEMKDDLTKQSFQYIRIKNTSLIGGNFVRCNLSGSEFDNVNISWMNLNEPQLCNCKWKNIKIHELYKLEGHTSKVRTVCFSPDGTTLASGSADKSISLWDVKTGQQKLILDGHLHLVKSVCFSFDGTTIASGVEILVNQVIALFGYGMFKLEKKN